MKLANNPIIHLPDKAADSAFSGWHDPASRRARNRPITVTAISDSEGNFELRCPLEQVKAPIWGRLHVAWAYAPGYDIFAINVYNALRQGLDEKYTFRLAKERVATFRIVLDPSLVDDEE